jgi:hypothetical protein
MESPSFPPTGRNESRRRFLGRSAATTTAAAVAAGATVLTSGSSAEAQFVPPVNELAQHFREIQQHEIAHVAFLGNALGEAALPTIQFTNLAPRQYRDFAALARIFENTGAKAYNGAAAIIFDREILAQAASIALVEARHASWLNSIFGGQPLTADNENFESPMTPLMVAEAVNPFFVNRALPMALASMIQTTPSALNDVHILRFAMSLELLEREFYNINVPRFFS